MSTQVVTKTPVRLSYVHLNEPRRGENGQPDKYGTLLIIPKRDTATVNQINEAVEAARKQALANGMQRAVNFRSPLRDGDGEKPNGGKYGPECAGCWVLNTSSKRQPGMVDRRNQRIIDPGEIYSGIWAYVDINFACFSVPGNSGIACYINNLQKVRDDEPLGGASARPEDVFAPVYDDDADLGL